jgi:hypothetical protein
MVRLNGSVSKSQRNTLDRHWLIHGATLGTTIHVPGKENVVCDHLSSGVSAEQLGLDPATTVDASTSVAVNSFMLITNPLIVYAKQAEQGLWGLTFQNGKFLDPIKVKVIQRCRATYKAYTRKKKFKYYLVSWPFFIRKRTSEKATIANYLSGYHNQV